MASLRPGQVVGVRFQRAGRVEYCDANGMDLEAGDAVVVEGEEGRRLGRVSIGTAQVVHCDVTGPLATVVGKGSAEESDGE